MSKVRSLSSFGCILVFFFFKQKTAYEMRISDWSSDVCSSDLRLLSVGIDTARVEGHTDSIGAESYNLALSQARAEAVAAPLRAGGMRLTPDKVIGRGEALPLSSNETAEGRRDNRRVGIIVTNGRASWWGEVGEEG